MANTELKNKKILVTGATGFIGANLVTKLLTIASPVNLIGVDNMNNYYDVAIKEYRFQQIENTVQNQRGNLSKVLYLIKI